VRSLAAFFAAAALATPAAAAAPERDELRIGFVKLTDCAPLVMAKELGYFEEEELFVSLEAQANWKILLDRVISGDLDAAHMLAGQPIGASVGIGTKAALVTALSLDLNGNAVTVAKSVWQEMQAADPRLAEPKPPRPISARALRPVVDRYAADGERFSFGMVFPLSPHNYELRYWLAAGGIHPGFYSAADPTGTEDAEVYISVTPPPQMPATLAQGTIQGYAVGEPWNQLAVARDVGVPVVTDFEIWRDNPEKVLGTTAAWADAHPETHVRLVKALIRAGKWLDASAENRRRAVELLAKPEYVGADAAVIAASMTGSFEYARGDVRELPEFNVFFRRFATYPYYGDGVWFLTQMRRWGQLDGPRTDAWYDETIRQVYRPDVWRAAAARLVAEGRLAPSDVPDTDGYAPPDDGFLDGVAYDGRKPNDYLRSLAIGRKD
jgi:nitrate/nitrite transport system substrate-binding protein